MTPVHMLRAEALLQESKWLANTGRKTHQEIIAQYEVIQSCAPKWAKVYFHFARFYESLLHAANKDYARTSST